MLALIKNILRPAVLKYFRYRECLEKVALKHPGNGSNAVFRKAHISLSDCKYSRTGDYVRQMCNIFKKMYVNTEDYYIYPLDTWCYREIPPTYKLICSITVDFSVVLKSSLSELTERLHECTNQEFGAYQQTLVDGILQLSQRIRQKLSRSHDERQQQLRSYFPEILQREPVTLDEALQKILFYDALFWQANHWHIGLGRLDVILYEYYKKDIENGVLTPEQAREKILKFCLTLSRDYFYKSKALIGDTGQYILLGGTDKNGKEASNELTKLFLEIFRDYGRPDPKLILRISENTPETIWEEAVKCVCAGNGSPLFMNERPIMEKMQMFGYDKKDLYQLGTSACWEPLIIGKSFDQNNPLPAIISVNALTATLLEHVKCNNFRDFMDEYKKRLAVDIKHSICNLQFDCSPLFSLFFDDCIQAEKDFTLGGSRYAYHGIQVISFPNTINSLLNIKNLVFEKKILTIEQCIQCISTNFEDSEDIRELLRTGDMKYGNAHPEIVQITNELMHFVGNEVSKYTINGRPIKVGFSSPNYIMSCKDVGASMDGRKRGEPFAVHISPISSNIGIGEILDFATLLSYNPNCINGNVVDFTIPPSYIKEKSKLVGLIKNACNHGLFELQLNVLNYQQLKDAKLHPEKYPNLIVRVWGFSAYFNDLPEIYKDTLIERARLYEVA